MAYLSASNAEIADGVRPILGGRWAAVAASATSVAVLLLLPLFMLIALVRRMGPYLSLLHRALLMAQAYLAIYFATLALTAAATGLEPLRLVHAASSAASPGRRPHRAAPHANWRVYAVYAACFAIVCACARAKRRKKAYLAGTDRAAEEWKKS
ncbi:hypothetical protein ZEAMMB73_Zm00001d028206 [Zea mays]|nr:hypothetical protein ZEAMMB73_Zm00001d028206 [Zea mays]